MEDVLEQAAALARSRRYVAAERLLTAILEQAPDHPRALHLLASMAEVRGDRDRAARILIRAAAANPEDFVLHAHLSSLLRGLGRVDESIRSGERAAALKPDDAVLLNDLAIAYTDRGDYVMAEERLRRAIALKPGFAEPQNNLGLIAQQMGRLDEAVACFERFLSLKPDAVFAYVNLLDSYTVKSADDANLREIERRLAQPAALTDADHMLLLFAAGKAYNDLGLHRASFEAALRACALKRVSIRYDETATLSSFEEIRRVVSPAVIARMRGRGFPGAKPIFVISMPRAGSTLVEQVLSSHPHVFGAGELTDLSDIVARAGALPQFLSNLAPEHLARIGRGYVEAVSRRVPDATHIVDKMPTNFLLAGLIHLALPEAKIIHVHRNPVDTCVSCFSKHFAAELNHTYDLGELGRYYRAYHRLMQHWRDVLPAGAILDVSYEDLVGNFETEARRLLAHCGLPWDEAVVRFHENQRPVKTLSVAQVRQPLYRTSIGRWREFEDLLAPLFDALGDLAPS